jgi:hypothetical protein
MKFKGNHRGTETQRKHRERFSVALCLCGCISAFVTWNVDGSQSNG